MTDADREFQAEEGEETPTQATTLTGKLSSIGCSTRACCRDTLFRQMLPRSTCSMSIGRRRSGRS